MYDFGSGIYQEGKERLFGKTKTVSKTSKDRLDELRVSKAELYEVYNSY